MYPKFIYITNKYYLLVIIDYYWSNITLLSNNITIRVCSYSNIVRGPVDVFDPRYVKNWLQTHNNADSWHNTGRDNELKEIWKKCWSIL